MEQSFLTRLEHEEFAKRMDVENARRDDENKRQNERLKEVEEGVKRIAGLTTAIEKMTVSIGTMANEIRQQGERLQNIESKPGKKWEKLITDISTLVTAAVIGYMLSKLGL